MSAQSGGFPFLAHGGAMGELIAGFDWAGTALGPLENWSASLRAHVATMLRAPEPMLILAGPEGLLLYNDPCMAFIAERDPLALGLPVSALWPELADVMSLMLLADQGAEERRFVAELESAARTLKRNLLCQPLMSETGKMLGVSGRFVDGQPGGGMELGGGQRFAPFRLVAQTMPGQVWTARADGRVDWMNQRLCAALGQERAPALEEGWSGLVHPQDLPFITRRWAEAVASGVSYEVECRLRSASGHYLWHFVHATPLRDAAGTVAGWVGSNVNIHARKMAEYESGRIRNRIWSLSRVYMLIFDRQGMIWQSNPAVEYGTGWRESALVGKNLLAFIHPEDVEAALVTLARVATGETIRSFECRCRMRNGQYRVIDWEVVPDGDMNHAVGRDLTEQHIAQKGLERTWVLSPVLKFVLDARGAVVTTNPAWSKALGWSETESRGQDLSAFMAPEDVRRMRAQQVGAGLEAGVGELTVSMPTKQGERRDIVWINVVDGGSLYGFGRDVTAERRAAAAAARASAERERIWVSANDLLAIAELDGRLRSVNPAWEKWLGHSDAALLNMPLTGLVLPEDKPVVEQALEELACGRPVRDVECRMNDAQGRPCLLSWSADPLGEAFYFVGRDVSAQHDAEEQLRQAQKMEAVGQLTGGIAHDFNNLLQGINGSLELLSKRLARGEMKGLERLIGVAMGAAERAAALTHRLLAFSRRQSLDPKPVAANPLVAGMEVLLRRTLGERVELRLILQEELWLTLCDSNQLENAVLNLAINARDAMPEGGQLTIETANVDRAAAGSRQRDLMPGSYVCISVADTGVGMDGATIAKAFEPFFTTKPLGQGTGLGLSMIYGFAQQSGGSVKIMSKPGAGTTVRLLLPRCEGELAQERPDRPETGLPAAASGESVLVVEDEPTVRALIVEVLGMLGYAALEAKDGSAGLEILQSRRRIDLLITDMGLPGLNGRQMADAARLSRPELKILFMTGYAESVVMKAGGLEPGMEIMAKPFTMDMLAARVRGMIAGEA
ncbi:PAS domain S-box protein [Acidocella sp.]|uniref:hybrid sensor histidine kinase/response regulator n=1 Tax=Acidocella sp. TaxID=50710 RepID=UPI003D0804F0